MRVMVNTQNCLHPHHGLSLPDCYHLKLMLLTDMLALTVTTGRHLYLQLLPTGSHTLSTS